jgi:predicted RNase H-like nuclease (RuvC/YqgF family)
LCAGDWLRESEDAKAKLESAETELEAARTGRAQADEKIEKLQQYMQVRRALWARRVRCGVLTRRGRCEQRASEKVKKLNGTLQDKEQAMERLEAELKTAWGRALEAEGDRLMLMERESVAGREMGAMGERLSLLEQGCWGLEETLGSAAAECDQVGVHADMD